MDIFLYVVIFIIGAFFGSFYTLAVYRVPKREDILRKHSYCPNCNHKLGFLDLFPIFSYIFLGGKCRYCKEKIRPRYLILEVLSGMLFILVAYLMEINMEHLSIFKIIEYGFFVLYLTFIILISGIDLENKKIDKAVNIYGIVISIIYMLYLCIVENANIYRYGIYLILYILMLGLDTFYLKKFAESTYLNGILIMLITMAIFLGEYVAIISIIYTLLCVALYLLLYKIKSKKGRKNVKKDKEISKKLTKEIPIGFFLGVSNILVFILVMFLIKNGSIL